MSPSRLDNEDWADDHGYQRGRCPNCGRIVWSDTGIYDCPCGASSDEPRLEEDDQESGGEEC